MGQQVCICVFAKPPEPGTVKTRLGPAVGNKGSATLAEAFLKDVWSAVQSLPWARTVIASTAPLSPLVVGGSPEVWLQGQGDLGARVERILRRALSQSEFAMALGADNPGLPLRLLEQARDAMRSADSVIGPCEDGGFYLLGLRQCPPGLLDGITWSHTDTFEQVSLASTRLDFVSRSSIRGLMLIAQRISRSYAKRFPRGKFRLLRPRKHSNFCLAGHRAPTLPGFP